MKKSITQKIIFFLIVVIFFIAVCLVISKIKNNSNSVDEKENEIISLNKITPEEMLSQMTLEEKIGQMLVVGFWGTEPDYYINKMINKRNVGGVILMKYNISDREQLIKLIKNLQDKSLNTNPGIPLFIAVDQEGGIVSRVKVDGVNELTAQKDIASATQAYDVAKKRAIELKELGINVNFSPVLDYITDEESFLYQRTFQKNIDKTGEFGSAMIAGYREYIVSAPKHFLGHPNSNIDPHSFNVYSDFSLEKIMERIKLFRRVFADVSPAMVMTSHVIYNNIDSENPCSLSKECIEHWLKEETRFSSFPSSVIITDDMEMGALDNYTISEAAVKAVQAGNDILLYISTPEKQAEAYNAIIEAVKKDEIGMEQIDESVLKILKLKKINL